MHSNIVKTRLFPTLSLLALLLASCAPAAVTQAPSVDKPSLQQRASPVAVEPSVTPVPDTAVAPSDQAVEVAPTEAPAPTPLPVATSRGPNLEATDPATVSLASGNIQFVEFFRFT
jgi:hypothetical protein